MISKIAKLLLEFGHDTVIAPLLIIGFIWINRNIFYHAVCLTLFSMILSYALKITFQIYHPIYGLIFPSGHMLVCTILYGWLAMNFNNHSYRISTFTLLCSFGTSLVYFGYHDYFDILGAIFFAVIFLGTYSYISSKKTTIISYFNVGISTLLILYIYLRNNQIPQYLLSAYLALLMFITVVKIFKQQTNLDKTTYAKILASIICFLAIIALKISFQHFKLTNFIWIPMVIILPGSCFLASFVKKTNNPT